MKKIRLKVGMAVCIACTMISSTSFAEVPQVDNGATNLPETQEEQTTTSNTETDKRFKQIGNSIVAADSKLTEEDIAEIKALAVDENGKPLNNSSSTSTQSSENTDVTRNYMDGIKKRTSNLPKNAKYFPFIQEGIPNWCYEQQPYNDNYFGPVMANPGTDIRFLATQPRTIFAGNCMCEGLKTF